MKRLETEHRLMPALPDALEICVCCHRGVMVYLGARDGSVYVRSAHRPDPWCYVCSNDSHGERYVRADPPDDPATARVAAWLAARRE